MNPNQEAFIDRLDYRLKKTGRLFQQTTDDVRRSWDTGVLVPGIWAGVHVACYGKKHLPVVFAISRPQNGTRFLIGQGVGRLSRGPFIDLGLSGDGELTLSSRYIVRRRGTDGKAETAQGNHWAVFAEEDGRPLGKVHYATGSTYGFSLVRPVITGNHSVSDLFCGLLEPMRAAIGEVWRVEDEPRNDH